ncbi:MAG: mechanosensitive ion channel family protein [Elusimicrobiota bacterium]|nr:MAG: mechanosensitive ion channel family protein [Elusimicrobiota bacterium]
MPQFDFLNQAYFGNTLTAYLLSAATFLGVLWGFLLGRRLLIGRLRALAQLTATDIDDVAVDILEKIKAPECYIVAFYFATRPLDFHYRIDRGLHMVVVVMVAYRIVTMIQAAVGYGVKKMILADGADAAHRDTAQTVTLAAQGFIWVGAALFVLSNFGFNVTSMVAGLGIGGIAVALAAQAVLGDLFSAVAIYLDKPFVVGDGIKVGDVAGTVEHVGVKTTRVRSVNGEMLVFPNGQLTSTRIQNFGDLSERRSFHAFSVPASTPPSLLKKIPGHARAAVGKAKDARLDRAHLAGVKEGNLEFELSFYVRGTDYNAFMDAQETVLLDLLESLRIEGVTLAGPARRMTASPN